ncbi:acetylornithine deacetylase ArgE domain protein [Mycobacterium xenopi 4042]|uniref:Acetylornithine deacetylase ArgE domain protein n=1 Tax=Mycobacterium xenopi 4042 TaxID=1299334 RepID=X8AMX0_MYCXE|nr:acetylornithine deacetylase ArgE domain protein [Mycobacterium xenopi 4042]
MRLLASLHDDDGNVAIAGLHESTAAPVDYRPAGPAETGLLDGVTEIGTGSVPQRLWPTGDYRDRLDTTSIAASSNTLIRGRGQDQHAGSPGGDAPRTLMRYAPISSSMRRGART